VYKRRIDHCHHGATKERDVMGRMPDDEKLLVVKQPLDSDHRARMGITIDPFAFLAAIIGAILLFAIGYLIIAAR
jgi:hypothetical protein